MTKYINSYKMSEDKIELFFKKESKWNYLVIVCFIIMISFNMSINLFTIEAQLYLTLQSFGKYLFYFTFVLVGYNYFRKRICPNDNTTMKRNTIGATVVYECKRCGLKIDTIMGSLP